MQVKIAGYVKLKLFIRANKRLHTVYTLHRIRISLFSIDTYNTLSRIPEGQNNKHKYIARGYIVMPPHKHYTSAVVN